MSYLISFIIKSFKSIFFGFGLIIYFGSFYKIGLEIKRNFPDNPSKEIISPYFLYSFLVYLLVLFLFQKLYLKNNFIKSLLFSSFLNLIILMGLFIIGSFISANNYITSHISLEEIVPNLFSNVDAEQVKCDVELMSQTEISELKSLIIVLGTLISGILIITTSKIGLIIWKIRTNNKY